MEKVSDRKKYFRERHQHRCRDRNMFQEIVDKEGLECFNKDSRRQKIRKQIDLYIRSGCSYRGLVEEVVTDMIAVHETLKSLDEPLKLPSHQLPTAETSDSPSDQPSASVDSSNQPISLNPTSGVQYVNGGLKRSKPAGAYCEMRLIILEMAAQTCQKYDLDNPGIMEHIITEHYLLQRNLRPWYEFLDPFSWTRDGSESLPSELYPFPSITEGPVKSWVTSPHLRALEYYLHYGKKLDLFVGQDIFMNTPPVLDTLVMDQIFGRVQFINFPMRHRYFDVVTPLSLACLTANPPAIKLLLRHGASHLHPFSRSDESPNKNWSQPVYILVNQLNLRSGDYIREDLRVDEDEGSDYEDAVPGLGRAALHHGNIDHAQDARGRRLLKSLRLIRRTVNFLPIRFTSTGQSTSGGDDDEYEADEDDSSKTTENRASKINLHRRFSPALPGIDDKCPASLEHLAKCKIRDRLARLEMLPEGIQQLPIPILLKKYIDLQYD